MDNHEEEKEPLIAQSRAGEAEANLSGGLAALKADNERLWKMIHDAQNASNEAGLIGMVGSIAWVGQIKKLMAANVQIEGQPAVGLSLSNAGFDHTGAR